jgi:HlyD family secretion protein
MNNRAVFRAIALATMLAGPANAASEPPVTKPAGPALPAITVTKAVRTTITDRVLASGMIEPVEQIFIQPQIEGQAIDALEVDVGVWVAADQVLARLSPSSLQLQRSQLEASRASAESSIAQANALRAEAEAAAEEAERIRNRAITLQGKGIASMSSAEQAESNATAARSRVIASQHAKSAAEAQLKVIDAQLDDIDLKLARTEVKAPFAGTVVEKNVMVGSIASATGKPMFVLVRDGLLELRADVAEQDVMRLREGQRAALRVTGIDRLLTGVVRLVEPTVNPESRLGRVRIAVEEQADVRWGMFVDADITAEQRQAVVVPLSAVGMREGRAFVLKVTGDRVAETEVKLGIREGGNVEIVSGIETGDVVVAKAGAFVRDGDRINPVLIETIAEVAK